MNLSTKLKSVQIVLALSCLSATLSFAQQKARPPIMGWSSWNHFAININEKLIREQADAMVARRSVGGVSQKNRKRGLAVLPYCRQMAAPGF